MITAGEIVKLKGAKIVSVHKDTTVFDTIRTMTDNKIGAITIEEDGGIIGIWTERDLLRNIVQDGFDLKQTRIGDCLISTMQTVPHSISFFDLEAKFLGLYTRHLFVTRNDKIIGIVSAGDVIRTSLNSYVSMEYYEDWRWDAKKR
jgi:signal-transduction protein with cAMP-binding, CBS, and nucleotidyltransferase domain